MGKINNWARVYDIIYAHYDKDIEFYRGEAKKVIGKILEIGCGTGRIYLELLKEGLDIYGIDIAEEMLNVLKEKAHKLNLNPKVYKADMKQFKLDCKFSLILIPARAFLHNLTINDQLQTLKNVKDHLTSEGKLILNFFVPDPDIMKTFGKELKKEIDSKQGKYILLTKSYFIDEINQIVEFKNKLIRDGKQIWSEKLKIALIYKSQFELLLKLTGFKDWRLYGGFNYQPLNSCKDEMVWIITNRD